MRAIILYIVLASVGSVFMPERAQAEEFIPFNCNADEMVKERAIVDSLNFSRKQEVERAIEAKTFPDLTKWDTCIAKKDVNSDGREDLLVLFPMSIYCASKGCLMEVYVKRGSQWKEKFSGIAIKGNTYLQNTKNQGYRDIKVKRKMSCDEGENCYREDPNGNRIFDNTISYVWSYAMGSGRYSKVTEHWDDDF